MRRGTYIRDSLPVFASTNMNENASFGAYSEAQEVTQWLAEFIGHMRQPCRQSIAYDRDKKASSVFCRCRGRALAGHSHLDGVVLFFHSLTGSAATECDVGVSDTTAARTCWPCGCDERGNCCRCSCCCSCCVLALSSFCDSSDRRLAPVRLVATSSPQSLSDSQND